MNFDNTHSHHDSIIAIVLEFDVAINITLKIGNNYRIIVKVIYNLLFARIKIECFKLKSNLRSEIRSKVDANKSNYWAGYCSVSALFR